MRLEKHMLIEGINDKGIFKSVFMAGHPGAGKTYVLNKVKSGAIEPRWVNTDKVFPIFKQWWDKDWPKISERVKTINKNQLSNYINSLLPLAVDGTANEVHIVMKRKFILESFGYDTMMIFVNTSLETALARASKRPRPVNPEFIKQVYDNIGKHKSYYRSKFDDFIEIKNDNGELSDETIMKVFKHGAGFYSSPIENPIGQEIKSKMIENGWKYLDPNIVDMKSIKNRLEGWYE
jgi:tRNA uridine 5-carbamoylmethylation protein Kti12